MVATRLPLAAASWSATLPSLRPLSAAVFSGAVTSPLALLIERVRALDRSTTNARSFFPAPSARS
jgi:hypothetical protein